MKRNFSTVVCSSLLATGVVFTSSLMSAPAQAFTLSINPEFGSTENTGATAELDFDFVQQGSKVLLNLGITNTTNGSVGLGATKSTLVGVAFDMIEKLIICDYVPGTSGFTQLWKNATLTPSEQFGTFDVGISPPRNSFNGGNPKTGLTEGKSTLVSFVMHGNNLNADDVESAFLDGFKSGELKAAGRFQQVNAGRGSDKVRGGIDEDNAKVPEPATLAGLGLAAGAMAMSRRRKASKSV